MQISTNIGGSMERFFLQNKINHLVNQLGTLSTLGNEVKFNILTQQIIEQVNVYKQSTEAKPNNYPKNNGIGIEYFRYRDKISKTLEEMKQFINPENLSRFLEITNEIKKYFSEMADHTI